MRNLCDVIEHILNEIPEIEQDLISTLNDILQSVYCTAPELMRFGWEEVYNTLWNYIPEPPIKEWQYEVLSIFSTKPKEELKKYEQRKTKIISIQS